jgi:hypothetical protein
MGSDRRGRTHLAPQAATVRPDVEAAPRGETAHEQMPQADQAAPRTVGHRSAPGDVLFAAGRCILRAAERRVLGAGARPHPGANRLASASAPGDAALGVG